MAIFRPDPQPVQRPPRVPASALTTGDQPPRVGRSTAAALALIAAAWIPPSPQPPELATAVTVVPPPPAVNNPTPNARRVETNAVALRETWRAAATASLLQESLDQSAGWVTPPITPPGAQPTPISALQAITAWAITADVRAPRAPAIAPLTLVYGDAPPLRARQLPAHVTDAWAASTPILVTQFVLLPGAITDTVLQAPSSVDALPAWRPSEPLPARRAAIAPLTLVYGQAPAPTAPLSATELAEAVRAWDPSPSRPPALTPTASWNVFVLAADAPPPRVVVPFAIAAGRESVAGIAARVAIAALIPPTLLDVPPIVAPIARWVLDAWLAPIRLEQRGAVPIAPPAIDAPPVRGPVLVAVVPTLLAPAAVRDVVLIVLPRTMVGTLPPPTAPRSYVDDPLFIDFDSLATTLVFLSHAGDEMFTLTFYQNEVDDWTLRLKGRGGALQDLTGSATRKLSVWDDRLADYEPIVDGGDMAIVDAVGGEAKYRPTPEQVAAAGKFKAEARVTYGDGTLKKFPGAVIILPSRTG